MPFVYVRNFLVGCCHGCVNGSDGCAMEFWFGMSLDGFPIICMMFFNHTNN